MSDKYTACEYCGELFPARRHRRRFCSQSCRNRANPHAKREMPCDHCGGLFVDHPSAAKFGRRYCGLACNYAAKTRPLAERIKKLTDRTDPNGCWIWQGNMVPSGYGSITMGTRAEGQYSARAHRVSWEVANGPIPEGLCVLHKCDNRACVNPDHLFLGTKKDNTKDARLKGRLTGGGGPKLTPEKVLEMRRKRREEGTRVIDIAREFGVALRTASFVLNYRTWKHVP